MNTYTLDIYLDDVNREYLNKLTFLALFKSRSMGFRCAADLFSEAFSSYDDSLASEFLYTLLTGYVSKYIITEYDLSYKEDLIYLLRHPSMMTIKLDPRQKNVRKKVLYFDDIENNAHKKAAFEYLKGMRPVKRASQIDRILEQYLITSKNEYYIGQAAARLLTDIIEKADFDDEGRLQGSVNEIVDIIWQSGKTK